MKKVLRITLYVFLAFTGLGIIGSFFSSEKVSKADPIAVKSEKPAVVSESASKAEDAELNKKLLTEAKATLAKLKGNFNYTEDEFKKIGFYTHKTFGKSYPDRKTVTVGLNSTGYIYLRSNYHADEWIFHNNIQVKSGETILESPKVENYSESHVTYNSGGDVWEQNTYEDDNGIIYLITISKNDDVKVRFNGRQFYSDVVLSKKDKLAIIESYELSQALKTINGQASL